MKKDLTKEKYEEGWEFTLPRFLFTPYFLILTVLILIAGWLSLELFNKLNRTQLQDTSIQTQVKNVQTSSSSQEKSLGFFKKVSNTPVSLENKPYFLYIGGQFCPFCAAERWSIVKALSNFGSWQNLTGERSSDGSVVPEQFLEIPTYNFVGATYTSSLISFANKEIGDKNGKPIPGQELSDFEKQWNDKYNPKGGVPFIFINGQYVQQSAGYSPGLLSGKIYEQVKADVENNVNTPYVTAINKEADIITAYLCKTTGNQPSNVCSDPKIAGLVAQAP